MDAFLVLFALSGLCFFTSCFFDRSERATATGGGLSIFSLAVTILGVIGHITGSVYFSKKGLPL